MAAIIADFSEDLRPQAPQLAQALPQPVKTAEVRSVNVGDQESIATIRYSETAARLRSNRTGERSTIGL
ncbi:MAG: hypothetical protein M3Y17_07300 [Actinomycetota bacterium]|nr:hypothetical protein [Actinomycetota bacterium]